MKEKFKDYSFWVGVAGSLMVLLHTINSQLNIEYIENVIMALLGCLSVAGIVHKPVQKNIGEPNNKNNQDEKSLEYTDIETKEKNVADACKENRQDKNSLEYTDVEAKENIVEANKEKCQDKNSLEYMDIEAKENFFVIKTDNKN